MGVRIGIAACVLSLGFPIPALAGMPAPLPADPERVLRLGDSPIARLQAISFFLLVFLMSALAFRAIWNYVRRDFPTLPRLSYGRAVAGVFLVGLLFVIVLTMISGARELMTPGAWRKQGATYKLAENPASPDPVQSELAVRRQHLERHRTLALRRHARRTLPDTGRNERPPVRIVAGALGRRTALPLRRRSLGGLWA